MVFLKWIFSSIITKLLSTFQKKNSKSKKRKQRITNRNVNTETCGLNNNRYDNNDGFCDRSDSLVRRGKENTKLNARHADRQIQAQKCLYVVFDRVCAPIEPTEKWMYAIRMNYSYTLFSRCMRLVFCSSFVSLFHGVKVAVAVCALCEYVFDSDCCTGSTCLFFGHKWK